MVFKDALVSVKIKFGLENDRPGNWRRKPILFLTWITTVLVAFFLCFALVATRWGISGRPVAQLYMGDCSHAKNVSSGMQAILSVVSISLTVCFDFFLRLVSSPTVSDLRRAHHDGRSLDIGTQSLRNLRHISPKRRLCWGLLLCTSVPIQLLLHSTTYMIFTRTEFSRFIVSPDFVTGGVFQFPGVVLGTMGTFNASSDMLSLFYQLLPRFSSSSRRWDRLDSDECNRIYYQDVDGLQNHRDVLMFVRPDNWTQAQGWKGNKIRNAIPPPNAHNYGWHGYNASEYDSLWVFATRCFQQRKGRDTWDPRRVSTTCCASPDCSDDQGIQVSDGSILNSFGQIAAEKMAMISDGPRRNFPVIDHCFSEPYSAPCKLIVSAPILLTNLVCILLGYVSSCLTTYVCWSEESCQVLGDAIQIFMLNSDLVTPSPPPARRWTHRMASRRLMHVIRRRTWLWTYTPIALFLAAATLAFIVRGGPLYLHTEIGVEFGFGERLKNSLIGLRGGMKPGKGEQALVVYPILANMAQLVVSCSYFVFSSLYSTIFQAKFWADFSTRPQRLRVSFPHADQQATYIFKYPFAWGLGLTMLKAAVGWATSQSLYVVTIANINRWRPDVGAENIDIYFGYSFKAILAVICISPVAALTPLFIGKSYLPSDSLIVGTASAAIAAFCPPSAQLGEPCEAIMRQPDRSTAWDRVWVQRRHLQPLRWGVLKLGRATDGSPEALGLGSEEEILCPPQVGNIYVPVAFHTAIVSGRSRLAYINAPPIQDGDQFVLRSGNGRLDSKANVETFKLVAGWRALRSFTCSNAFTLYLVTILCPRLKLAWAMSRPGHDQSEQQRPSP
ncbi:hypothetical protein CDD83_7424 [Cordyceps sp. RAO-2017]|nr:hypothetical protein CDD83_7424 [Cordyceps sp. RAO-2017]